MNVKIEGETYTLVIPAEHAAFFLPCEQVNGGQKVVAAIFDQPIAVVNPKGSCALINEFGIPQSTRVTLASSYKNVIVANPVDYEVLEILPEHTFNLKYRLTQRFAQR